jgi:hypothetical protein
LTFWNPELSNKDFSDKKEKYKEPNLIIQRELAKKRFMVGRRNRQENGRDYPVCNGKMGVKVMAKNAYQETLEKLARMPPRDMMSEDEQRFYANVGRALVTNQLEYLIEAKQWAIGIIVSASMLEYSGKTRLIWRHGKNISTKRIDSLNLAGVALSLFTSGIIDAPTYKTMEKIRKIRNELSHNLLFQFKACQPGQTGGELEELIRKTVEILTILLQV